jgi:hypothetical protein
VAEQAFEFQEHKELVAQPPVLRMADFSKQFTRVFHTDANGTTLEIILFQEVEVYRQPITYASRTLKLDELKEKSVYKLECWDSLFGIANIRGYLKHREFLLETQSGNVVDLITSSTTMQDRKKGGTHFVP